MSRRLAILGAASPAVTFYHNVAAAHIDHWLDGYAHPFLNQRSDAAAAIVGHCRLLMELAPDSMPGHLAHHRETTLLTVLLHGIADMPNAVAFHRLSDAEVKSFLRSRQQLPHTRFHLADCKCICRVAIVAVNDGSAVNRHYVALPQRGARRNPMHNRLVDRNTKCVGIARIPEKSRNASIVSNELFRYLVKFQRGNPRSNPLRQFAERLPHEKITHTHQLYFFICLQINHPGPKLITRTCGTAF